jgi:hypothetical protein
MTFVVKERTLLAVIDSAADVTSSSVLGWLALTHFDGFFELGWAPHVDVSIQRATAVFRNLTLTSDDWIVGKFMRLNCQQVSYLSFELVNQSIILTLTRISHHGPRKFCVDLVDFFEFALFIEHLLLMGIAVPADPSGSVYSLKFYPNCRHNVYGLIPPHIHIKCDSFTTIEDFWGSLLRFFTEIMVHLANNAIMPQNSTFPFISAALTCHNYVMAELSARTASWEFKPITDFASLFDDNGRLYEPDLFFDRAFATGLEPSFRAAALPFVFRAYPLDSTSDERRKLDAIFKSSYDALRRKVNDILENHFDKLPRLAEPFRTIDLDVPRTDRQLPAFASGAGHGPDLLTELLKVYCLSNPRVGYLQGMNDLFVPLIHAFLPDWDNDGNPVDQDGTVIDYREYAPIIFKCYEMMLNLTKHFTLLAQVKVVCLEKVQVILGLLDRVSPFVSIWLRHFGLQDLVWMYPEFVLMYKRSMTIDILNLWIQINSSPAPADWLIYFTTAIFLKTFPDYAHCQPATETGMMSLFPDLLPKLDMLELEKISLWIYRNYPLEHGTPPTPEPEAPLIYFEADWLSRA